MISQRKRIASKIIRIGLPIMIGELGFIAVGFADNIMVGHYSTSALASASMVNNIFNIAFLACIGFSFGLTPLVGAKHAVNDKKAIKNYLRDGLVANVIMGLLVTVIMGLIYLNIDKLDQPEELMPEIRPYFIINLIGLIPVAIFHGYCQWSYGIKETKLPMWITIISDITNVVGNYILIFGHFGFPELGLTGAGISTLFARIICPTLAIIFLIFRKEYKDFIKTKGSADKSGSLKLIFGKSIPVSLQMTFETTSFSLSAIMAGWIGALALASYQIVGTIGTLGFCIYYSFASSTSVLIANAKGLNDNKAMRNTAKTGYIIILILAAFISSVFFLFGEQTVALFSNDPEVVSFSTTLLVPLILYQLGDATQVTFANCLRGTANVIPMLWIAFFSYIVIGLPTTYIIAFPCGLGCEGIVLSFSVSLFVAGSLYLYYFIRSTRNTVNIQ